MSRAGNEAQFPACTSNHQERQKTLEKAEHALKSLLSLPHLPRDLLSSSPEPSGLRAKELVNITGHFFHSQMAPDLDFQNLDRNWELCPGNEQMNHVLGNSSGEQEAGL